MLANRNMKNIFMTWGWPPWCLRPVRVCP